MNKPDEYEKARQVYIGFCRGKPCTLVIDLEHRQTSEKVPYRRSNTELDRM